MRGSVRKDAQRGSWCFVVDVGVDPATGKRRQKFKRGFKTRKAAETALRDVFAELRGGEYVEPSAQPLGVYLEHWLETVAVNRKESTAGGYAHKIRRYVIPRIGAMPLRQVDAATLDTLYADLLASGGRDDEYGSPTPLSSQTVALVHRILHRAFKDAVHPARLLRSNPAADVAVPRSTAPRTMKVWTADELRAFLASVTDERLRTLWVLAATTGMRRGELCGLQWDDISFAANQLAVRRSRVPVNGKIIESTPKSDRTRVVALDPGTVAILRAHRRRQLEERLAAGTVWRDTGYVFCNELGVPVRPDAVTRAFKQQIRTAGLSPIELHGLRHTHATLGLAAGVPVKIMSERLGHAKTAITEDLYMHVAPTMQHGAAETLGAIILGP